MRLALSCVEACGVIWTPHPLIRMMTIQHNAVTIDFFNFIPPVLFTRLEYYTTIAVQKNLFFLNTLDMEISFMAYAIMV